MIIGSMLDKRKYQEKREKIEEDISGAIIEMQSEIEWLKKDNAMLKGQIVSLLDLIGKLREVAKVESIIARKEAFCAMADCVKPIIKGVEKGFGGK